MYNSKFIIHNSTLLLALSLLLCSCHKQAVKNTQPIRNFPPQMVGTWAFQFGPLETQKWQITFEEDGTIHKIAHNVFGPVTVEEGGINKDGPDAGTYMEVVLGPLQTEYDPKTDTLKATVTIDSYMMQFVEGALKGRMIDNFVGPVSKDGKTWAVQWRSYGWLEGATEPPMDFIDANPALIEFQKVDAKAVAGE